MIPRTITQKVTEALRHESSLAKKLVALALRPNRMKNRDLWDITWLKQQAINLPLPLVVNKIADHKQATSEFIDKLEECITQLENDGSLAVSFEQEIRRFLPPRYC